MSFEQPFYRYGLTLEIITALSVFLQLGNSFFDTMHGS